MRLSILTTKEGNSIIRVNDGKRDKMIPYISDKKLITEQEGGMLVELPENIVGLIVKFFKGEI